MNEVPSGTITFLFTDIDGSTGLARHHEILQQAIETQNGSVFQTVAGPSEGLPVTMDQTILNEWGRAAG